MNEKEVTKLLEAFAKTYYHWERCGRYHLEDEWVKIEVQRFKLNNPELFGYARNKVKKERFKNEE